MHVNDTPRDPGGVIYLAFEADGTPLYIGQTANWAQRRALHMYSRWWAWAAEIRFIPTPDRSYRLKLERAMIAARPPLYNGNVFSAKWGRSMDDDEAIRARRMLARDNRANAEAGIGPREVGIGGFWYGAVGLSPWEIQELTARYAAATA